MTSATSTNLWTHRTSDRLEHLRASKCYICSYSMLQSRIVFGLSLGTFSPCNLTPSILSDEDFSWRRQALEASRSLAKSKTSSHVCEVPRPTSTARVFRVIISGCGRGEEVRRIEPRQPTRHTFPAWLAKPETTSRLRVLVTEPRACS